MVELYPLLEEIGTEAEKKVKSECSGPLGSIKSHIYCILMPMVLQIQTEKESHHFIFQKDGSVTLHEGAHGKPDVTFSGEHAELLYLLQNRDKKRFEQDERTKKIKIISRTFKGRQAVMKLRDLFL